MALKGSYHMNRMLKLFFPVLLIGSSAHAATTFGKTFFNPRPQGVNQARWMVGQMHHFYLPDVDCINGSLALTAEYDKTFRASQLGQYLGFNGTDTLTFGPAGAATTDVFARNFLLNDDFQGSVKLRPSIQNFVLDINWYLGLDEWVKGLWFRVDVPISWTRWNVNLKENETVSQGTTIAANRFGNALPVASSFSSITEAWEGGFTDANKFPDIKQAMQKGKIKGARSKTGVADVTLQLGYNFILNECSHFGLMATLVAPTGTTPNAEFVFEPHIGNGHHVAFGGGLTGSYELWNNGCDQSFGLWFEGNVLHLFRSKQRRLFDLTANGIGSRYLFFKKFDGAAPAAYANEIVFGANISALECKVKNDVYGDAAVMFDYKNGGFTFDVGYNIWGRTEDKITIVEDIPANTFGVQGDTATANPVVATTPATQSLTDIKGNFAPAPETPAVTITKDDFDPKSASNPSAVSHKVFTHLAYTWENCDYLPFLGVGGAVEFSGTKNNAMNQWQVWVKGGFTFS